MGIAIPALTTAQMREVERIMNAELGIEPIQIMENAGRCLARQARELLDGDILDRPITVLIGGDNNGSGLVAARHLLNWGAWTQVVCAYSLDAYSGATARQLGILQAMGAPLAWAEEGWELPPSDLIIDALMGCELDGAPQGHVRDLIALANSSLAPILSLDSPSGVDADTGACFAPHVRAEATLTLALPKRGLAKAPGRDACGALYLADISAPPQLFTRLGLHVPPIFARDTIVKLNVVDDTIIVET